MAIDERCCSPQMGCPPIHRDFPADHPATEWLEHDCDAPRAKNSPNSLFLGKMHRLLMVGIFDTAISDEFMVITKPKRSFLGHVSDSEAEGSSCWTKDQQRAELWHEKMFDPYCEPLLAEPSLTIPKPLSIPQ